MKVEPPRIDERTFSEIFQQLQKMLPHYTPELNGDDGKEPGVALMKIYAYLAETVLNRLNQAPRKNMVAFLDMLGIRLLPARSARAALSFTLAKGTEKGILIPPRTQAAADKTAERAEQLFETESTLLAIGSRLKMALGIDPARDAIYQPPPGFLEGALQGLTQRTYQIVSSPPAGARDFQLNHVTDLKEGDYLRLGQGGQAEYVIIAKLSGLVVTIRDRLRNAHDSSTPAVKVVNFSIFEGNNLQEHSLYLGHKELFNIKSSARFTIHASHRGGPATDVTPLKLSWEYWGELTGEEGEQWRPFSVSDGSQGLSREGGIELLKSGEGEIKEKEINGLKNRWIRCRVLEPLAVDVPRRLPLLDNVMFVVGSSGENLLPELAFNNDIPLDPAQPFAPFGVEPRMFDNFLLGDKEIFSKKGARISIDVSVAPRGLRGAPAAIEHNGMIKVYAVGSQGRLSEVIIDQLNPGDAEWPAHDPPPGTRLAAGSTPAVVNHAPGYYGPNLTGGGTVVYSASNPPRRLSVFARGDNGHLLERYFNGIQWQWLDHGTPQDGVGIVGDPCAVYGNDTIGNSVLSVFTAAADGILYELYRDPRTTVGTWQSHAGNTAPQVASSPQAVIAREGSAEGIVARLFVAGRNGNLYGLECQLRPNNNGQRLAGVWTDCGAPDSGGQTASVTSRPFVQSYGYLGEARVFVSASDGNLWECDSDSKIWKNLESPAGLVTVASAPHGYMAEPDTDQEMRIFVRGSDGALWERDDSGWQARLFSGSLQPDLNPFCLPVSRGTVLNVFSISDHSTLLQWDSGRRVWNDYQDPGESVLTPSLSWEYWNDRGWGVIKGLQDGTVNLLRSGRITFELPENIAETEIAGQKSYWLRARIVGGDFGREAFALKTGPNPQTSGSQELISSKNGIRAPLITDLAIGYVLEKSQFPQKCLTFNNLDYLDQSDACRIEDKHFSPFVQLEDADPSLYLGFEKAFAGGPVKIFLDADELPFDPENKPKLAWSCSGKNEWLELDCLDASQGLVKREILELIAPGAFAPQARFGAYLHWLKGSLAEGSYLQSPTLAGIHPNTTWALQAASVKDEILGSGNGEAHQSVVFLKAPVLTGELVRVREILTEEERQALLSASGEQAIHDVRDPKGVLTESWVRWSEVADFFDSRPEDRHYTLDRASGQLRFGDGEQGRMPPEYKDSIKAFSYQYGGGGAGNVRGGEIKTLKSAVAGVDKVTNPVAADGGADTATLEQMLEIGPARISHRQRAVTAEDFQWLARDASRKVARAKCLPNTRPGSDGGLLRENGRVTVVIVPDSPEPQPQPSRELKSIVQGYLEQHCSLTLSSAGRLHLEGPRYTEIDVSAELFVASPDLASLVEREARRRLTAFLHPLSGGPQGKGWEFGRDVSASDLYALLEGIEGLDHLENLRVSAGGKDGAEVVSIPENSLVAAGRFTLKLQLLKKG